MKKTLVNKNKPQSDWERRKEKWLTRRREERKGGIINDDYGEKIWQIVNCSDTNIAELYLSLNN